MPIKVMCPICGSEETLTIQEVNISRMRKRRKLNPRELMCAKCSLVGSIEEFTFVMPNKEIEKWIE